MEQATILLFGAGDAAMESLATELRARGGAARLAAGEREAFALLAAGGVDLVLLPASGEAPAVLARIRADHPDLPVLLCGGDDAQRLAMLQDPPAGVDVLRLPARADDLVHRIRRLLAERGLRAENARLSAQLLHRERGDAMVGTSAAMARLRGDIDRLAGSDAAVLVRGEPGAGKRLAAEALHYRSARAAGPLVRLHCAALPGHLLEAELFGRLRSPRPEGPPGRIAAARNGTLVLEDVEQLPDAVQARLLHWFAGRGDEAHARFVSVTGADLAAAVRAGRFREDLLRHLATATLAVPPLRERGEDVLLLAGHFAREAGVRHGRPVESVAPGAQRLLRAHGWPGNVSELRAVVERAVLLGTGPTLEVEELDLRAGGSTEASGEDEGRLLERLLSAQISFDEFERQVLVRALRRARGNQSRAARLLGMTRRTLQYRVEKYGIKAAESKADG